MSAHTTYYQVPPYTQHAAIPQGWRPPFPGAPPIPSGMNINPQLWQAGRWQPNPAYFSQHQGRPPQQHQQSWVASQAWQQPRAQESKNPYKRVAKPPSAEYLASRLSDNPLGLTDMVPAEQFYAQQANETANGSDDRRNNNLTSAESPWIWNPPSLVPDDDEHSDVSANHDPTQPRTPSRSLDSSVKHDAPSRRSSDQTPEQPKRDAFTTKRELVPTFSINIVRTPEHYKSSPSRSSSRSSTHRSSVGSVDSQQLAARMENLSTADFPSAPIRQPSIPDAARPASSQEFYQPPSLSDVSDLVEEPANTLLSPLILTTPKPASRGLGRYSTFPFINGPPSLDTIPEASMQSTSDQQYDSSARHNRNPARGRTDPADAHPPHPHRHHRDSPNHPSANNISPYFNPSPSHSSQSPSSSHGSSQHPSPTTSMPQSPHEYQTTPPTSGSSKHSNPLLPSSMEPSNAPNVSASKKRARKGYWNKRGDHLTMSGYIVYAPQDQSYPQELQDYPDPSIGYRDEKGQVVNFLQRPEHPDSRSRHGQLPLRPYGSFIEYV